MQRCVFRENSLYRLALSKTDTKKERWWTLVRWQSAKSCEITVTNFSKLGLLEKVTWFNIFVSVVSPLLENYNKVMERRFHVSGICCWDGSVVWRYSNSVTVYSGTQALASRFWIYFKEMKMIFRKIYRLPSALEPANCILAISFTIGAACLLSSVLAGLPFSLSSSCCCPSVSWFQSFSEIWSFNPNSGVSGVWFERNSF